MKKKKFFMMENNSNIAKYNNIVKQNHRKRIILIGFIVCVAGILFFLSNIFSIKDYRETKNKYHSVMGTVIDWNERNGMYSSIVEYELNGEIFKISEQFKSSVRESKGTKLEVIYDPEDPKNAILVKNFETHVIVMTVVSILVFLLGLVIFIIGLKMQKERKSNEGLSVPKPDDVYREEVARRNAEIAAQEAELARIEALIKEQEEALAKENEAVDGQEIAVEDKIAQAAAQAGSAPVMRRAGEAPPTEPPTEAPQNNKKGKKSKEKPKKK